MPVAPRVYSGWRLQGSFLLGEAPFYVYPFINLRGIPSLRYQSNNTLVSETEWNVNIYQRWSLLAFFGGGKAFSGFESFGSAEWAYSVGTGFRYEIAWQLGVRMGMDFAWGNGKDFAFYIVFGTSWL